MGVSIMESSHVNIMELLQSILLMILHQSLPWYTSEFFFQLLLESYCQIIMALLHDYFQATRANSAEVRRILTMGLPYSSSHAGQILFGPEDGYLYLMISDGSPRDDPYNFAQNKKSLLGKILRIDVDHKPSNVIPLFHIETLHLFPSAVYRCMIFW